MNMKAREVVVNSSRARLSCASLDRQRLSVELESFHVNTAITMVAPTVNAVPTISIKSL
jgi:hypothetical protein